MAGSYLFRMGKIKGKDGILKAMKHNKRTLQNERGSNANIDASKTHLNYCLAGDEQPQTIYVGSKIKLLQAGIENPRKNAVMAVEIIFSLPIERHQQNTRPFFVDCLEWVQRHLAGELLAFDVHLDESAPHAHAVVLPLIDGKLQGNKLMGNTGNLARLRGLFYKEVGQNYGLQSNKKSLTFTQKSELEKQVLRKIASDPVMRSSIWPCVRDAIHTDPLSFAQTLSINIEQGPPKKSKSFVDYKRSRGQGVFLT
jgi:hypothetical protein